MFTDRRAFLGGCSAAGFSSIFGAPICRALANQVPKGPFKRCVVLWMEGGPSQQDTFDPKPGARDSVATSVHGVRFADTLSNLASRADELCVVRSVGSREGEHTRATELMHTGFSPVPSFPRPPIGSMVSHKRNDPGFPKYVALGGNGFGPAFLGADNGPFVIGELDTAREQLARIEDKKEAMDLLTHFNAQYGQQAVSPALQQRASSIEAVRRLLDTPFPEALDVKSAKAGDRERYGDHEFGRRVMTAARLLRIGVPFVEAELPGWDTHIDNNRRTDQLCGQLQHPWLALIDDLQQSGMWDDTLIVWMGEFGRTPRLNGRAGRDHFPESTPVVLAGGNLGGRVIGQTSEDGTQRIGQKHSVADLMATLLMLMGLDPEDSYTTDFGSPTTATDGGKPIGEITNTHTG